VGRVLVSVFGDASDSPPLAAGGVAYDFDGSADLILNTGTLISGTPYSMACWFNTDSVTGSQILMAISPSSPSSFDDRQGFLKLQDNILRMDTFDDGAQFQGVGAAATILTGTWYHAAGVVASSSSRKVYRNGTVATNSTAHAGTHGGFARLQAAAGIWDSLQRDFFNGRLFLVGFWNVALSDGEVASLAGGASPATVQAGNLVAFMPFTAGNAADNTVGADFTVVGSPDQATPPF
jgi:hypothetical protein